MTYSNCQQHPFLSFGFGLMVGGWGNETKVDKITVGWFSDVCKHDLSNVK